MTLWEAPFRRWVPTNLQVSKIRSGWSFSIAALVSTARVGLGSAHIRPLVGPMARTNAQTPRGFNYFGIRSYSAASCTSLRGEDAGHVERFVHRRS